MSNYKWPRLSKHGSESFWLHDAETLKFIYEAQIVTWLYCQKMGLDPGPCQFLFFLFHPLLAGVEINEALQHFFDNTRLTENQIKIITKVFSSRTKEDLAKKLIQCPLLSAEYDAEPGSLFQQKEQ